jgi:uracil-DNA glycosylase
MITNVLGIERSAVLVVDLARDARPVETIGNGLVGALGQLRPANILIMGSFGARALLGPDQDVAQSRGKWLELCWDDGACPVRVTHHPEAILALEAKGQMAPKRETFEDLKAVAAVLFEDPSPA